MTAQTLNTTPDPQPADDTQEPEKKIDKKKFWEAFKNFAIIFSFVVNIILVLVLLMSPVPLFMAKSQVAEPLLVDLDSAFASLGETTINTLVNIQDTMPVVFDLPLNQNTDVILTQAVPLQAPASFILPGGGGSINGTVNLDLPEGMRLPVSLNMMVPVSTTIPVVMEVPVKIQLAEAGMGPAIEKLRAVFKPITGFLQSLPNSPKEVISPSE
ncbi:MAG: hypothetical protein JXA21_04540 [Anaerolineae bacterium]|nr:hypothetical protein [Anaerolineae bacterium]